jgi:hypothetical protein
MISARFCEENAKFTMLVFLDRLSWVDCISSAAFRDFLILCPSTPLSREQTGAAACKKELVKQSTPCSGSTEFLDCNESWPLRVQAMAIPHADLWESCSDPYLYPKLLARSAWTHSAAALVAPGYG